jgi:hypothetical protein
MKVRFLKEHPYMGRLRSIGEIVEWNDWPVIQQLERRGILERVGEEIETASVAAPERAVRKRGRPRKITDGGSNANGSADN